MVAALAIMVTLTGCAQTDPRVKAIEAARSTYEELQESIEAGLGRLPAEDFREYLIEVNGLGEAASLIGFTDEQIRQDAYSLQYGVARTLDASQQGDVGTALLFVSGYYETGGGLSYVQETAYSCFTVTIDLPAQEIIDIADARCSDAVYAIVDEQDDVDLSELQS